jgi:hypothetical protein
MYMYIYTHTYAETPMRFISWARCGLPTSKRLADCMVSFEQGVNDVGDDYDCDDDECSDGQVRSGSDVRTLGESSYLWICRMMDRDD